MHFRTIKVCQDDNGPDTRGSNYHFLFTIKRSVFIRGHKEWSYVNDMSMVIKRKVPVKFSRRLQLHSLDFYAVIICLDRRSLQVINRHFASLYESFALTPVNLWAWPDFNTFLYLNCGIFHSHLPDSYFRLIAYCKNCVVSCLLIVVVYSLQPHKNWYLLMLHWILNNERDDNSTFYITFQLN